MRRIAWTLVMGIVLTPMAWAQFPTPPAPRPPDPAALFRGQCGTCHSVNPADAPRQGPNLFGAFGRRAGTLAGFKYSPGFAAAGFAWDEARLDAYLTNPQSVIPGGVMAYRQANPAIRQTIIAWLKEQH